MNKSQGLEKLFERTVNTKRHLPEANYINVNTVADIITVTIRPYISKMDRAKILGTCPTLSFPRLTIIIGKK